MFEQKADQENAASMAKYMRNLFPFYGIPAPERKAVYKDFIKEEKRKKIIDWEFLDQCYKDEHREFQYLAYDYLIAMSRFLAYDDIPPNRKIHKGKTMVGYDRFFGQSDRRNRLKRERHGYVLFMLLC